MRDMIVSNFDTLTGRLVLGFVNAASAHPILTAVLVIALLVLAGTLGIDAFKVGRPLGDDAVDRVGLTR